MTYSARLAIGIGVEAQRQVYEKGIGERWELHQRPALSQVPARSSVLRQPEENQKFPPSQHPEDNGPVPRWIFIPMRLHRVAVPRVLGHLSE